LIVDDDPAILKVSRIALERRGYIVRLARNGEDALILLKQWIPDIMLVDVRMPEMTGFDLLSRNKKGNLCPEAKIVIVTGHTDPLDEGKLRIWVLRQSSTNLTSKKNCMNF